MRTSMDYLEAEPISSSMSNGTVPSSSSSVASRLYLNGLRRDSFSSEPELINLYGDSGHHHSHQMSALAQKLNELQEEILIGKEERMNVNEEKSKLRTDNAVLQERIHILEEQLQASEQRWAEKWEEEKIKVRELTQRFQRERHLETESEELRHSMMAKEIESMQREKGRLTEQLKEAKANAEMFNELLTELRHDFSQVDEDKRQLKHEFERYKREVKIKMANSTEMFEELSRQTDQLRQNGLDSILPRKGSLTDQIIMLEDEIDRLRKENRELREQNCDLQAQLLHDSIECGRNLLSAGQTTLATELSGLDSPELFNKLKEQEIINQRLRNYINIVLEKIMELHPSILEIKRDEIEEPTAIKDNQPL